jgi:hypothetical protein
MAFREPVRIAVAASLLYATYVVIKCPCDVIASCQQTQFYAATVLPIIVVAIVNANSIS